MRLIIRKIGVNDCEEILLLVREFAEFERLSAYCNVEESQLISAMFSDDSFVEGFLAFYGENSAGYTLFYPGFSSFRGELGLNLEDLYVREEYRGKGIGRILLQKVAQEALQRGFVRIDLMVNSENPGANAFYRKLGAQSNPEERHFKFSDEAFVDLAG